MDLTKEALESSLRKLRDEECVSPPTHVHIDKSIPVALIVTIFMVTISAYGAGTWYMSSLSNRVAGLETIQGERNTDFKHIVEELDTYGNRLTKIEANQDSTLDVVRRLDANAMKK